jgi:hypothetical protein
MASTTTCLIVPPSVKEMPKPSERIFLGEDPPQHPLGQGSLLSLGWAHRVTMLSQNSNVSSYESNSCKACFLPWTFNSPAFIAFRRSR